MIRLSMAFVDEKELQGLEKVFLETVNFGLGIHVKEFEEKLSSFLETDRDIIAVNTGTSALHLALEALSFPKGSEVLVPSITFVASYQAIIAAGLVPVSCEILMPCGHIDPSDLPKKLNAKTVAIMPVSYSGTDFNRAEVYEFARTKGLRVIEDNAHTFGSRSTDGSRIGVIGDISCFSFDGIKNITCGEGGAIVTADKSLAHRIRVMRSLGIEKDVELRYKGKRSWDYDVATQGFRYHMSNINAAIGISQLNKIEESFQRKTSLQNEYRASFAKYNGHPDLCLSQEFNPLINYHLFPILLPPGTDRAAVRESMLGQGIETGIHYVPNHLHTLFRSDYSLPFAEDFGKRTLSLPYHPRVTPADAKRIVENLCRIVGDS